MAPRLITLADADRIIADWSAFKFQELAAYAREEGWTRRTVERWLANPDFHVAIDPATETLGVGIIHHQPETLEISVLFTLTTGTAAARQAADTMLAWALRRAQGIGITEVWGEYLFPVGVDAETTRAVRYARSFPSVTVGLTALPEGTVFRFDADIGALAAQAEARL